MISKQYIKQLEFNSIEEFFNYVVESKINGNYTQTKEFIKKMNDKQFLLFINYTKVSWTEFQTEFLKMRLE